MKDVATQYAGAGMSITANIAALTVTSPVESAEAGETARFPFSPETLLFYCSSRLGSIDNQIGAYFKDQQAKNRASKELSDVQGVLGQASYQHGGEGFTTTDAGYHVDAGNKLLNIYRNAETPEGKQAAADAFRLRTGMDISAYRNGDSVTEQQVMEAKDNIAAKDANQWAQVIEGVKSKSAEVSKSAELNMIQLQSLVSQRQLAVQLTTQLMQAVHEGSKNVAGNIRA